MAVWIVSARGTVIIISSLLLSRLSYYCWWCRCRGWFSKLYDTLLEAVDRVVVQLCPSGAIHLWLWTRLDEVHDRVEAGCQHWHVVNATRSQVCTQLSSLMKKRWSVLVKSWRNCSIGTQISIQVSCNCWVFPWSRYSTPFHSAREVADVLLAVLVGVVRLLHDISQKGRQRRRFRDRRGWRWRSYKLTRYSCSN